METYIINLRETGRIVVGNSGSIPNLCLCYLGAAGMTYYELRALRTILFDHSPPRFKFLGGNLLTAITFIFHKKINIKLN